MPVFLILCCSKLYACVICMSVFLKYFCSWYNCVTYTCNYFCALDNVWQWYDLVLGTIVLSFFLFFSVFFYRLQVVFYRRLEVRCLVCSCSAHFVRGGTGRFIFLSLKTFEFHFVCLFAFVNHFKKSLYTQFIYPSFVTLLHSDLFLSFLYMYVYNPFICNNNYVHSMTFEKI